MIHLTLTLCEMLQVGFFRKYSKTEVCTQDITVCVLGGQHLYRCEGSWMGRGSNWAALKSHQSLIHPGVTSAARMALQNCPKLEQGQTTVF